MTRTTYWYSKKSLIVSVLVALVAVIVPGAQAAFTSNFDALLTELQSRSTALTGSPDKTEQKEKKAADKIIAKINKPATTLAADVKTAGSIAKSLPKAFPSEFPTASVVFSNNLSVLLGDVFDGLTSDVTDQFTSLQNTVNALPDGKAKNKALASVAKAQVALDGTNSTDFVAVGKSLAGALKSITSGLKAANSGGGGGGVCTSSTITMTVSNEGPEWHSTTANSSFNPATGDFTLGAIRGTATPLDALAIGLFPVTGQGDYTIGETSIGGTTDYVAQSATSYALIAGTIHIATFHQGNVGVPTGSTTGTFHFTAQDVFNNVITIDGSFDICDMVTLPSP